MSLAVHTALFLGVLSLYFFGFNFDRILLVLTTILSFEAIYLAIFIQMTVNRNTIQLYEVEKDIEEIQEDVEEISEEREVTKKEEVAEKKESKIALEKLEKTLAILLKEIEEIKKK